MLISQGIWTRSDGSPTYSILTSSILNKFNTNKFNTVTSSILFCIYRTSSILNNLTTGTTQILSKANITTPQILGTLNTAQRSIFDKSNIDMINTATN